MAQSQFPVVRRGYEPNAVDAALEDLQDRVAHAEATTHAARSYSASILAELRRLQALEDELTTALELARQTGAAIVEDARQQAATMIAAAEQEAGARMAVAALESNLRRDDVETEARRRIAEADAQVAHTLAEARVRLAAEAAEMEKYRMAIAVEASMLSQIEKRLGPRLSRAAARLIEVVDAPDGIGPFSQATSSLVDFARLLQRAVAAGALDSLELQVHGGDATLHLQTRSVDLRGGEPMVPLTQPGRLEASVQENALNISSMALS